MKKLTNVIVPLITPLTKNDRLDVDSLENFTNYLIEKEVDCLYPCGTTGEMVYLTNEERKTVVETVVNKTQGRIPVYAQVGAQTTADTIELAKHAVECGADGIGILTPYYFAVSDDDIFNYFSDVIKSVPSDYPVYLYGIPQNAVNDLSLSLVERVAETFDNVQGLKYSFPDMTKIQNFMGVRGGNFDVLVGPDHLYQATMAIGGKGTVSGNASIIPEHYNAITKYIEDGNVDMAIKVQRRTNMLNAILCAKNNIANYKTVLQSKGVIATNCMRRPMQEVSDAAAKELMRTLNDVQFDSVLV